MTPNDTRAGQLLARASGFYERYLWNAPDAAPIRAGLAARGLAPETLRAFHVGYSPPRISALLRAAERAGFTPEDCQAAALSQPGRDGHPIDRFRGRLMFPITDTDGAVRGFGARATTERQQIKYLNSPTTELFTKGELLFGTHQARKPAAQTGTIVLAEGYVDAIALHQAGITNAVAIMGTALTPHQAASLRQLARRLVLALDTDGPGQAAALRAGQLAEAHGLEVRVAALPDRTDPAQLLTDDGAPSLRRAVAAHVPLAVMRVEHEIEQVDLADPERLDQLLDTLRPTLTQADPDLRRNLLGTIARASGRRPTDVARWSRADSDAEPASPELERRRQRIANLRTTTHQQFDPELER